mmetsp:Transcript_16106/g.65061  ORF Transcript_16106/g.65061 Transcript_16106/m.65061 type:complete len:238 (+) Transcript_16106:712-1425(+)
MPAASAMTFLTAPPTSSPTTSCDVKTRNDGDDKIAENSYANRRSSEATTTAVARPSAISRANDGPDRNAYPRSRPRIDGRISHMSSSDFFSIPFDVHSTGALAGTNLAILRRYRLEYCTGTACTTNDASRSADAASVVASMFVGNVTSDKYRGCRASSLTHRASSLFRTTTLVSMPLRAHTHAIANPKLPPPRMAHFRFRGWTLLASEVDASAGGSFRRAFRAVRGASLLDPRSTVW